MISIVYEIIHLHGPHIGEGGPPITTPPLNHQTLTAPNITLKKKVQNLAIKTLHFSK